MIPIDRASKDPFFRYKMPAVQAAHDPSKTTITNLEQIARSLHRNPSHILKFLSMFFGCSCVQGKYALNGNFEAPRIQSAIFDYIDTFVLCKRCRNPETHFVFGTVLKRSCSSCGEVFAQDSHKLNVSIIRDKDKNSNVDTNYDSNSGADLHRFFRDEQDHSQEVYAVYKQENWGLGNIFSGYVRPKDLKQLALVLKEHSIGTILEHIESMVEAANKENKIGSFIKALEKLGFSAESIEEHFSKPREGKKRSPLVKKNVDFFFESEEAQS